MEDIKKYNNALEKIIKLLEDKSSEQDNKIVVLEKNMKILLEENKKVKEEFKETKKRLGIAISQRNFVINQIVHFISNLNIKSIKNNKLMKFAISYSRENMDDFVYRFVDTHEDIESQK